MAIRADSLLMGVTYALGIGSALTVSVIATRVLSKSDVALLGWCLASAMLLAVLAGLGTPQASIRLWTRTSSRGDPGQFARLLSIAATGTLVVVVVWWSVVGPALVAAAEGDYASGVPIVALWVPAGALMMLNEAAARSQMNFRLAAFCGDWVRRSLVVFGLALVGAGVFDVTTVLVSVAVVEFVLACGITLIVGGQRRGAWARSSVAGIVRDARVAVAYLPPSLVAVLVPQAGVWLCALVASPNEVADLSIAIRASFLVNVPFFVGGRVFAPRIADADELSRLEPAMRRFATLATGFAAAVTVTFLVVGEELISLAFGSAYRSALPALLILTVGQVVTAAAGLCGQCLAFRGQSDLGADHHGQRRPLRADVAPRRLRPRRRRCGAGCDGGRGVAERGHGHHGTTTAGREHPPVRPPSRRGRAVGGHGARVAGTGIMTGRDRSADVAGSRPDHCRSDRPADRQTDCPTT